MTYVPVCDVRVIAACRLSDGAGRAGAASAFWPGRSSLEALSGRSVSNVLSGVSVPEVPPERSVVRMACLPRDLASVSCSELAICAPFLALRTAIDNGERCTACIAFNWQTKLATHACSHNYVRSHATSASEATSAATPATAFVPASAAVSHSRQQPHLQLRLQQHLHPHPRQQLCHTCTSTHARTSLRAWMVHLQVQIPALSLPICIHAYTERNAPLPILQTCHVARNSREVRGEKEVHHAGVRTPVVPQANLLSAYHVPKEGCVRYSS